MILTTQGLVLHTTKYAETSIIAKVFTRELGLRSYMVKGVRSAAGRHKQNLLQPLSHLDMTVYENPKKELQYIKEMQPSAHYHAIGDNSVKTALLFFMDEVLYKSLKEEEPNKPLFDYVVAELNALNDDTATLATQPIEFLLHTARHLGIEPMDNYSHNEPLFNLKEGRFQAPPSAYATATNPNMHYCLDAPSSSNLHYFMAANHCSTVQVSHHPTAAQRNTTLSNLLEYYQVHLSEFRNFKSHEVLHAVLR